MRAGAKIEKFAVAIERNRFVRRNVLDDVELELARLGSRTKGTKFTTFGHGQRFVARNVNALERMVRLDLLLHLGLDFLEIFGRDAMRQFDVVIKTVLHRRPGGELRFRPDFQNGGCETCAAEWRRRSMSVIWARCSSVLRSSLIDLRDSSVRAGLPYSLGMTKARSPAHARRMTEPFQIGHLGALF